MDRQVVKKKLDDYIHTRLSQEPSSIDPSPEQLQTLIDLEGSGPLHFVNLLKFKDRADYPDGHELAGQSLSGHAAYAKYGRVALEHIMRRGGRIVSATTVNFQLIGPNQDWDEVATMEYQSADAFLDMITDSDYQSALVHRDAGLLRTEIFVTRPLIKNPVGRFKFNIFKLIRRIKGS